MMDAAGCSLSQDTFESGSPDGWWTTGDKVIVFFVTVIVWHIVNSGQNSCWVLR